MVNRKVEWVKIIGIGALILALFFASSMIFYLMERVVAAPEATAVYQMDKVNGDPSNYFVEILDEAPSQTERSWIESAADWEERYGYWLFRREKDDYLLYLPTQDCTLSAVDITADEERDTDGVQSLVLRIRTPEGSEPVLPEHQLFCIEYRGEQWDGSRVRVILDGREISLLKLVADGDVLYSPEAGWSWSK